MFENIYNGTRVLITGHTGFKGSWLAAWLVRLGAGGGLSLLPRRVRRIPLLDCGRVRDRGPVGYRLLADR